MLKKLSILIVAAMLLVINHTASATVEYVEDFQTWGQITARGNFGALGNEKVLWWVEGQGRFGNDSTRFSQGIIRPGIGYAVTDKISVWLGYAWIPTSVPFSGASGPYNEHRIWQQILWNDRFSFGSLQSRTRFEQRYFDIPGSTDVGYRVRQLFKLTVPIAEIPNLSFVLANEIFFNTNDIDTGTKGGFDQNRVFGGFGYRFTPVISGEIGYMNQYFNRNKVPRPDQMQHILGVNLFLNF
ncbi:MAG: DUF2490 domain-containing protein [Burkholderiales bacterium]|nr:DUF2490 domain-containing protein [Burkholderiales bacterium]MDR4517008.1 DUF2490 domain-containing protein [Nitrosomonas sp.]